jgi:hypothetical protein
MQTGAVDQDSGKVGGNLMEGIVLLIFIFVVALSVTVQSRMLTWLEAMKLHSGVIFIAVALGAALVPVIIFALAVAFFSRERS